MRLWRKNFNSSRPASSSPIAPTGSTFTPRSARLLTALAPPPGTSVRSRCFRISTGASRDTREISPNTNSSATRSPSTVIVILGKASTIFRSRSTSLKCFVIRFAPCAVRAILSRAALPVLNHAQHGIHGVSCVCEFHFHWDYGERRESIEIASKVHCIFLGGDEAVGFASLPKLEQIANIFFRIKVVVAIESFSDGIDAGGLQLQQKILRPRDAAEHDRPRWNGLCQIQRDNSAPHAPNCFACHRKRFGGSAARKHHGIRTLQRGQRLSQPSRREQTIAGIVGRYEHDVEIAS